MNKIGLNTAILMILSISIYAENITIKDTNTSLEKLNTPIEIRSVRSTLSAYDPVEHTKGQLRAGFINFDEDGGPNSSAFALGGHFHLYSKRWNGFMVGAEAYAVINTGIENNAHSTNGDFYNDEENSFVLLTQAYLDGKWGNTEIKLGRQSLDTPHADSDDIRMMPNYFEAYTVTNTDIDNFALTAGLIDKMAGWENGVNSAEFVDAGETLEAGQKIDGVYYTAVSYEGFRDLSLSLWYYHYSDIANVLYAELGYEHKLFQDTTLTLGLQYDGSKETGAALLGAQDAQTYGISMETTFEDLGISILAAYNQDNGDTGAMGLSLGGGAFFTSMEDQTLDALGTSGKAWVLGAGYSFEKVGVDGLAFGIAYGDFKADEETRYHASEVDVILEYEWDEKISATAAYTAVEHKITHFQDYSQLRIIANYNF